MKELRPLQQRAIDIARQALMAGNNRLMLQAPTGFGKTVVAAAIIRSARRKGRKVVFTVPATELIDQTVTAFWNEGIRDIGVIQADHPMTDAFRPVQVASIQTLTRRKLPEADLVLIDEAHRNFKLIENWMADEAWASVPFIGLTATPWTKGLGRLYDRLLIAATLQELIDRGDLAPFRVFAPSHPDLSRVRVQAGDYREDDLSKAMNKPALTADVVTTWLERGGNLPTLCFAVDCAHAQALQAQFQAAGVTCGYVDANTPKADRKLVREAFARGDLQIVCNVGVLTTGVDWDVRCIILARPTKSEILYVQIIGRGLRTAPGKGELLILDHSDTTLQLGFVTDIHHEKLDDGTLAKSATAKAKERQEPKAKECSSCKQLRPAGVTKCPGCGFEPKRQSDIVHEDGALIELDGQRKAKLNKEAGWPEKQAFIAQLRCHAARTHKREAWVAHSYRSKYGVWPNSSQVRDVTPAGHITPEVERWIRAKAIRFAKSQKSA